MRYGFIMPGGDARRVAELAVLAEQHGWDGFFVWEGIWAVDAWVALTAAAMRTERIRLGTMLTPLPRRRPWELASQTATLDNLSGGRVILSVGLGVPGDEPRFWIFEDDPAARCEASYSMRGWTCSSTCGVGSRSATRASTTGHGAATKCSRRQPFSNRGFQSGWSAPGRG